MPTSMRNQKSKNKRQKPNNSSKQSPSNPPVSNPTKRPENFSSWIQERIFQRWGNKGLALIWIGVGMIGAITFIFNNWDKQWVQPVREFFEHPLKIKEAEKKLSREEAAKYGMDISYGNNDSTDFSILLQVTARFFDSPYNTLPVLRSISELKVVAKASGIELQSNHNKVHLIDSLTPDSKELKWVSHTHLKEKPVSNITFDFDFGPRTISAEFGSHQWEVFKYKQGATDKAWFRAQGSITLILNAPDWLLLQSARLLPGTQHGTSLVEALVQNYSDSPIPVEHLILEANHPRPRMGPCHNADPLQVLTLNWNSIISNETQKQASTELGGVEVMVPTKFNGSGFCSDFSFSAIVPLQTIVAPKSVSRITLHVKELPVLRKVQDGESGLPYFPIHGRPIVPKSLEEWLELKASLKLTDETIRSFPSSLYISKRPSWMLNGFNN